jgi:uncharacterized protein YdiU (UPF0061 family)
MSLINNDRPAQNTQAILFNNSYARLPERFYQRILPVPVSNPTLIHFNHALAQEHGLDIEYLTGQAGAGIFSGNIIPDGAEPIALAYAGHQFGHFTPQLGDGRAVLLGEIFGDNNKLWDIQLKGSGPTTFSRNGDGRAALGPIIREYIVSEAMHRLGIRTNRSLAMVTTGEDVFRETKLPGAILTRFSSSHIRVGTFEYFRARKDIEGLQVLTDYVIGRLYPSAKNSSNPYLSLFKLACDAQAALVASWMQIGFIHGVMNTDNMAISGETIDYGPCAFMDTYDLDTVYSSIDHSGRYAFGNQSNIAQWNLTRLAECLLTLLDKDEHKAVTLAEGVLNDFPKKFQAYWLDGMRNKLGLTSPNPEDADIARQLLQLMQKHNADYTLTFRYLCSAVSVDTDIRHLKAIFSGDTSFNDWVHLWRTRLANEPHEIEQIAKNMQSVNPAFIPRNHQVEKAINSAIDYDDFSKMKELIKILTTPYIDQPDYKEYMLPPKPDERVFQTFCGT